MEEERSRSHENYAQRKVLEQYPRTSSGIICTLAWSDNVNRTRCTQCTDSYSLNTIIHFTRTPGRRMSREFLRTCSNMLPLLVETVEAEQRYRGRNRFFYYDESIEERREKGRKRHGKKDETH